MIGLFIGIIAVAFLAIAAYTFFAQRKIPTVSFAIAAVLFFLMLFLALG